MGRAIEMEKKQYEFEARLAKLENIVRGMTHTMNEMDEKSSKTTHVDLTGKEMEKIVKNVEEKVEEEETNNEGNRKSSKQTNSRKSVSGKKAK